jgi:signal transduction histidine kinase
MGPIGLMGLIGAPSAQPITNHFSLLTSHPFDALNACLHRACRDARVELVEMLRAGLSPRSAKRRPVDNGCKAPHSSVMKFDLGRVVRRSWAACLFGGVAIGLLTIVCAQLHTLSSVPALLFMVVIVLVSLQGRFVPAIFIPLVAIVCLDYWFIKPGFSIASEWTLDLVGLVAYLTTAIVITSLLAKVRNSFQELRRSEARLAEGERLSRTGSWTWTVSNRENVYWSAGHFRIFGFDSDKKPVAYEKALQRIHPDDVGGFDARLSEVVRQKKEWDFLFRVVVPGEGTKHVRTIGRPVVDESGNLSEYVGTVIDVTEQHHSTAALERAFNEVKTLNAELTRTNEELLREIRERQEAQEALKISEQQRIMHLVRANEALRGFLDTLADVPELDDFLGQVMASINRYLGATLSTLRLLNSERNRLTVELVLKEGRVLTPIEAGFPAAWRSVSPEEQHLAIYRNKPTTVTHLLDPKTPTPPGLRQYLIDLGIRTGLIMPLTSGGQMHGLLAFYFYDECEFDPETLEIARALAIQAGIAIHLTRLARTAKQSAVLEERNRLAGEIHDSLAQIFAGISMQLFASMEGLGAEANDSRGYIERATELAHFGLAEARRSALSLRSDIIEDSGLVYALQMLVERSNIAGRLRCNFSTKGFREETLSLTAEQGLLRIAQEAISNALRHAKPTVISVVLKGDLSLVTLEVRDNGTGIDRIRLESQDGLGIASMRDRAKHLDAQLDIRTAPGNGTTVTVRLPLRCET